MSLDIFETEQYSGRVAAEVPARLKALVELLCAQTSASVYRVDADTDESYDALIFVGGDRTVHISGTPTSVLMAIGYMDGENFEMTNQESGTVSASSTPYADSVLTLNDSGWDVSCKEANTPIHLRAVELTSSINGQTVWSCGVYSTSSAYTSYPSHDFILIDGTDYPIQYATASAAAGNIPAGKIMLFPSLLTTQARNYLGSPSIGRQRPYMMIPPNGVSLTAFSEFKINAAKFISLGAVAIRSE